MIGKVKYFFGVILLLLFACDNHRVFDKNEEIPDNVWDVKNKIIFEVEITDTLSAHNMYVNVRQAEGYPYSNLYVFLNTKFPDGKTSSDTLNCILADLNGKWLGDGAGDIFDNRIPYRRNVRFPVVGTYTFEIIQAMRDEKLPLIMDVGLRIEKVQ